MIDTQKKAAEHVGLSTRTIRKWELDGLQRDEHGVYDEKQLDDFKIAKQARIRPPLKKSTAILKLKLTIVANKVVSVEMCEDRVIPKGARSNEK